MKRFPWIHPRPWPLAAVLAASLVLSVCGSSGGAGEPTLTSLSSTDSPEIQPPGLTPSPKVVPPSTTADSSGTVPDPTPTLTAPRDRDLSRVRRTAFAPLDQPEFLEAEEAGYLADDELVLGLEWQGQARAYPVSMLTYHHVINDAVDGRPVLITY